MISVLIDDSGLVVAAGHIFAVDAGHEVDGALYPSALGLVVVAADQLPEGYVNGRWRLDGGAWVALETAEPVPEPAPAPVPDTVSQAQLRIALHRRGLLTTVQAMVDAASDPEVSIRWSAPTMERHSPLLIAMASLPPLALTEVEIDQIFREAGAL